MCIARVQCQVGCFTCYAIGDFIFKIFHNKYQNLPCKIICIHFFVKKQKAYSDTNLANVENIVWVKGVLKGPVKTIDSTAHC